MISNLDIFQRLDGIGVNINNTKPVCPFTDIEKTLLLASREITNEPRFPNLLLTWIKNYGNYVNVERLNKMVTQNDEWVIFLALYASRHCGDKRWELLIRKPKESLTTASSLEMAEVNMKFRGEEDWTKDSGFLVAKDRFERAKDKWVLSSNLLAEKSRHFANKLQYGASAKADIATALEAGFNIAEEIAAICYCTSDEVIEFIKNNSISTTKLSL